MWSKINILRIIRDHLKTLYDYDTKKMSFGDYIVHFIIPIGLGVFLAKVAPLAKDTIAIFINIYAILIGLFLSVIALLFNFLSKLEELRRRIARKENPSKNDFKTIKWREALVKEIFANLAFSILLALISILVLVFLYGEKTFLHLEKFISIELLNSIIFVGQVFGWASIFIQGFLVLMILKRMHTLFEQELSHIEEIDMNEF